MRFADIRSALVQSWVDGSFGLDTAYPNKNFDPDARTPWAELFILPAQPDVGSLGSGGDDRHNGVLQVSLHYPLGRGDGDIMAKADEIAAYYVVGREFAYDSQSVHIRTCGQSQGRVDNGWYRIDLSINWTACVSRAPSKHYFDNNLLLESSDFLLLESGDRILLG